MEDKFKKKYRISPARLATWDYSAQSLYYVTICTKDRNHYFGEILPPTETHDSADLKPTEIGAVADSNWQNIPKHFPFVKLYEYVIMPNHLHAILFFNKPDKTDWQPNKFGPQSGNLASVLRGFKASVKTYATLNNIEFGWQPRFYDRIIRNEKEYFNIQNYIVGNPQQWLLKGDNEDDFYP